MAHAATQSVVSLMYDLVDAVKRYHRQLDDEACKSAIVAEL